MKALGYVRLSKLEEGSTSPAKQRQILRDLCRARGWELVDVFEDLDVSGGKESRRGLDAMLARLADADAVVVWKLDRLARSIQHLIKLAAAFEGAGVELVTSDGTVDTTSAAGKAFFYMRGIFAQFERDTVAERTKGTHDWLRAQGRVQSRTPFGFRVNADRRFERDPDTWPTLVAMMQRLADGDSLRRIGADHDLPHTTIRIYVRNRRAIESLEQDEPGLVERLRARLADDTFRPGPRALLSGLARCYKCGTPMRQSKRNGHRTYSCKVAGHVHIRADWLDEFVTGTVLKLAPWAGRKRREGATIDAVQRAALEKRLGELQEEYDDGLLSRERYVIRRDKLLSKMKRGAPEPRPRLETAEWDALSQGERRLALREVLEAVEIRPVPAGKSRRYYGTHADRAVVHFKDDQRGGELVLVKGAA
jgi:DNA invertase Pin-like site-specific DNA recombinase